MSNNVTNLHKKLIEQALGKEIIGLELQCSSGQEFVYVFWYDDGGQVVYSVARVVGNQHASLADVKGAKKEDTKEAVEHFCEVAQEEDSYDGSIPSVPKKK